MPSKNVILHPIIVVNNRMFGVRGINYILRKIMWKRIFENEVLKSHSRMIDDLQVIDYDILVLTVAHAYKDFGSFQGLLSRYQTYVHNASGMSRFDSLRFFAMNHWEQEKTAEGMKRFEHGYKRVVKSMTTRNMFVGLL